LSFAGQEPLAAPAKFMIASDRSPCHATVRTFDRLLRQKSLPLKPAPFTPYTVGRQVRLENRRRPSGHAAFECWINSISLMESTRHEDGLVYRAICREKLLQQADPSFTGR
jgi:hypothetical protein